jgi:cell shape-determining protein MreC
MISETLNYDFSIGTYTGDFYFYFLIIIIIIIIVFQFCDVAKRWWSSIRQFSKFVY